MLFYNFDYFSQNPLAIFQVWKGGMAFHGALVGCGVAIWVFARRSGFNPWSTADLCTASVPIGLFFGRIANFINAELYGRPWDGPWSMVFPTDPLQVPRHPSQLYEAALEGVALFTILFFATRKFGFLKRPGATMGLFISGGALGGLFGRLFVSALADATGWREATLAMAVIALVASVFFARSLPPSRNFQPQQLRIGQLASSAKKILRDPVLLKLIATGFLLMGAFVTTFNYMTYRLVEAPFNLSHSMVGLVFLVYLTGMSGSASIGNLASRRNRGSVLFCVLVLLLAGIVLTLSDNLLVVIIGLALLTFAFFSGHSIASSWTSSRATQSRALAASLYLFAYYQGSSLLGTGGGYLWQSWGWSGVVVLTSGLTIVAGLISIGLTRNYTRKD